MYTIFLCCFSKINKNGTNNSTITKLSANTFGHSDKPQPKLQCCSFISSCVIRLSFIYIYIYIYLCTIFYATFQKLIKTEQTIEKLPYFREILLRTRSRFIQNFNVVASFALELLRFVFYISIYTTFLRQKNLCNSVRTFLKREQTIEKPPNSL